MTLDWMSLLDDSELNMTSGWQIWITRRMVVPLIVKGGFERKRERNEFCFEMPTSRTSSLKYVIDSWWCGDGTQERD